MGAAPLPFRARLLPTGPDDVPPVVGDALAAFCADAREVEAGYVCRVERLRPGAEPERRLRFMVRLARPVREREDAHAELQAALASLARRHPALARDLGVGVLADRAVPAWDRNAQSVYPRA